MSPEPNLRIPGPTSLPPAVREAGARQMINHRGPEFAALLERLDRRIRPYFGTKSQVLYLTASGSGGLEAAIVNTLSPGDRVLAISIGAFGERFAKIASLYGADVTLHEVNGVARPTRRRSARSSAATGASRRCSSPTTRPRPG